jgi:hypothetical protein
VETVACAFIEAHPMYMFLSSPDILILVGYTKIYIKRKNGYILRRFGLGNFLH